MTKFIISLIAALVLFINPVLANHKNYGGPEIYGPTPTANLQPNDVVVFAGDSITRLGESDEEGPGFVETFTQQAENFCPGVTVIGSGVPGNTTANLVARFNSTVLAYNPTVVILFIGINDIDFGVPAAVTYHNYETMINACLARPNVREIVLCGAMCRGEYQDGRGPVDKQINALKYFLYSIQAHHYSPRIYYMPLRDLWNYRENRVNPARRAYYGVLSFDSIHPNSLGMNFLTNAFQYFFQLPYSL